MFREMRRNKQSLAIKDIEDILENGTSGVLALIGDDDYPYAVPMSYLYYNSKIYFHCAREGHKIDAIKKCNKASFCVVAQDVVVPEKYSTNYRSVIAFGKIRMLEKESEVVEMLEKFMIRYAPNNSEERRKTEIDNFIDKLYMFELDVEHITGKESLRMVEMRNGDIS